MTTPLSHNTREAFERFDAENPVVWAKFKEFTRQAIDAGLKHFGVAAIWERLRWWSAFETVGDPFKLNNNWRAWFSRKFAEEFPIHAKFFLTRDAKADEKRAWQSVPDGRMF